ncbi:protein artichoke [Anopheles cruzii]|uniref:protein artichoke n=1 Tax=Anopheles cruzii TaxID=68878 RepID=UPI0022EC92EB|nr:protein artichoke [Anopheles cruzii]
MRSRLANGPRPGRVPRRRRLYSFAGWWSWLLLVGAVLLLHHLTDGDQTQQQQQQQPESQLRSAGGSGGRARSVTNGEGAVGGGVRQSARRPHATGAGGSGGQQSVMANDIECPSFTENSACPCYKFEDGIFLECPGITYAALRATLRIITSPIQSLSVYDFDRSVKALPADLFGGNPNAAGDTGAGGGGGGLLSLSGAVGPDLVANVSIRQLQFSHSSLKLLKPNSLLALRAHLESLSIVNGKLTEVPSKAIAGLKKLLVLDFDSNEIGALEEYTFYGLHLVKLNLKGNRIERLPVNGLAGLEDTLAELDLSENRLRQFPTLALRRLENLRLLRLSMNEIASLEPDDSFTRFGALSFLDLSQNNFVELYGDFFGTFPFLKTLSLYSNFIETVHRDAFASLKELQSLDLSHNKIVYLDAEVLAGNRRLHTVDLSRNHLHYVAGVFANLPVLREIFLSENNILELTDDCFANSTSVKVIYLEHNAIQRLGTETLATLTSLEQLFLSHNLIHRVPALFFDATPELHSLALDGNALVELDVRLFRRLAKLREVRLNHNRLQQIRGALFAPVGELMELHLQNNELRVIERGAFRQCRLLQYINLQDNALEDIDTIFAGAGTPAASAGVNQSPLLAPVTTRGKLVSGKGTDPGLGESAGVGGQLESALLSIQLNSNALKYLHGQAFRGQTSVQMVWLENNQLKALDRLLFLEMVHLEKLYLRNNTLVSIETGTFDPLVRLKYLDLSRNRLSDLSGEVFRNLTELEELYLGHNLIESLRAHVFGKLRGLRTLDLSHNNLQTLGAATFQPALPVSVLNLRGCNLTRLEPGVFRGLDNLNELTLDENRLSAGELRQIEASSVRTLRLGANNFTELGEHVLERLPSLQSLSLVRCNVLLLPYNVLQKNVNLVKLDLSFNQLRQLPRNIFTGLNVFRELRLHSNAMSELPFLALLNVSTLEVLTLSHNQLTFVDFYRLSGVPNLRTLDLHENSITSLSGFSTDTLPHLDTLDLSGNLLLALPEYFFKHSTNLQRIDLSLNRFGQIPNEALSGGSLARLAWLNLSGNPLQRISTDGPDQQHYPHLKELYIRGTNLSIVTSKDFAIYPALQSLHLVQNRINRISPGAFFALVNLQLLDLSVNELELLPKERLQGLRLLEVLNISTNSVKELDEFAQDLQKLRVLDASSNQLERLQKNTLRHLVSLQELYLYGNRLVTVSSDAFRTLRALTTLDLRKNYFETAPLRALKPLETHLQQLRIEDNPLVCSCDTQELWELLSDHRKWTRGYDAVRCEQPPEVQGKRLLAMEPQEFCDVPLILKIAIQDIQPYSVLVSWQSREHSGLHGFHIIYHSLDTVEDIRGKTLNRSSSSAKLARLSSNTRYLICVLGLSNWLTYHGDINALLNQSNQLQNQILNSGSALHSGYANGELDASLSNTLLSLMMDTPTSRCTEVRTLDAIGPNPLAEVDGMSSESIIHSILTRRLGLIVGCCLGIVVFIVLVSVLGWLKIKKQRLEAAKRQQQPHQPEFISYRHFSIPNDEHGRDGIARDGGASMSSAATFLQTPDGHPAFISGTVLGTTTTVGAVGGSDSERKKLFITDS